jgi:hypothetical protein
MDSTWLFKIGFSASISDSGKEISITAKID